MMNRLLMWAYMIFYCLIHSDLFCFSILVGVIFQKTHMVTFFIYDILLTNLSLRCTFLGTSTVRTVWKEILWLEMPFECTFFHLCEVTFSALIRIESKQRNKNSLWPRCPQNCQNKLQSLMNGKMRLFYMEYSNIFIS